MQHRKIAFATSKSYWKNYYPSINNEPKNLPQHLFHVAWNILNLSMKMQHQDKHLQYVCETPATSQQSNLFLQHPNEILGILF